MSDVDAVEVEESRLEELGNIFDQANAEEGPLRDESGRFKASETVTEEPVEVSEEVTEEITEQVTEELPDQSADAADEPETGLEAPASWSETAKAGWASLPRELQDEVLRREGDWQRTDGERAEKLKGYEPIEAALAPARQRLQLSGVEPATYVSQLVAADNFLRENPSAALQWLAKEYGVDLQAAESAPVDPAIAPFVEKINALEGQLTQFTSSQQEAEAQRVEAEIAAFATDHPHFEEVRTQMGAFIQSGSASDMQSAYDMAVWANPSTRAKLQAEQAEANAEKAKEAAAERAAKAKRVVDTNLSSKGTAGGATPPQYKTREDELSSIYDNIQGA